MPLEYMGVFAGFLLLIFSVGLLILQNKELVMFESRTSELYENIRSIDSTFIQAIKAAGTARRYARSRRPEDFGSYKSERDIAIDLLNLSSAEVASGVMEEFAPDVPNIFLNVLQELSSALDGVMRIIDSIPGNVNDSRSSALFDEMNDNAISDLIDRMYRLHDAKLSAVDRIRELRSARLNRTLARNNIGTMGGIFFSIGLFLFSFLVLRNKMQTIGRYSRELKAETQRAQRAEKIKSEFLANMSHEIRTPMTAILGFSELLQDGVKDPKYISYLTGIEDSGRSLLNLINDILDLSKIEAGRFVIKPRNISIHQFISGLNFIFGQMAKTKGLDFSVSVDPALPDKIILDDNRVRQILTNLLGNAIKFTQTGFVRLSVSLMPADLTDAMSIRFAVSDSGIGISAENQKIIFDAFRQVDGQATRNFGGTGLGLSISLQLAHLMNGSISVQSEEGRGSTFILVLPLTGMPESSEQFTHGSPSPAEPNEEGTTVHLSGGRVLIAEDDPRIRTILADYLRVQDVEVFTALDGAEALAIMAKENIDVLVTDIMMPNLSGRELIAQMRRSTRLMRIPVIIAAASTQSELDKDMPEIQGFLKMPFSRADLLESLSRFLPHEHRPGGHSSMVTPNMTDRLRECALDLSSLSKIQYETLVEKYSNRLRVLRVTLSLDGMAEFGNDLMEEGERLDCVALLEFGQALATASDEFDIEAISALLARLNGLLATAAHES